MAPMTTARSNPGGPSISGHIEIRDCGPRDGLQSEAPVAPGTRAMLAERLFAAGLHDVEVAAFVSPQAVPAMAGAADVVGAVAAAQDRRRWVLVPNRRGAQLALDAGISHLTVTISASPVYSEKNVGMSTEAALEEVAAIRRVVTSGVIDAVVSCAFGSPFGDHIGRHDVVRLAGQLIDAGVDRLTLADTTGVATPRRLRSVVGILGTDVGLHLHDTRGTALANALSAIDLGVRRFDTALGGLGGSPFAPGAGGNLATEDLVLVLEDMGCGPTPRLTELLDTSRWLADVVHHPLPSRVAAAGLLPPFT